MAVTASSPTSDYTAQDYQLPNVDPTQYQTSSTPAANPYGNTTPQYGVYQAYVNNLDRAPENNTVLNQWSTDPNYATDIANTPEAQTLGRARNEINPQIDAQIQAYQRQAELARQTGESQLGSLVPEFNSQRSDLSFGLGQNQLGLDQQLAALRDQTDFAGGRLQSQINPAILAARESAARSGLLNSTVAIDRVNQGLLPIEQQLGNLAQSYQTSATGIDQKRQSYVANYQQQLQDLGQKQSAAAKNIQDQVALQLQQYASQAAQEEATRNAQIYARSGSLSDLQKQYQLQNQQVQGYLQNLQQQQQTIPSQIALNNAQSGYYSRMPK